MKNLMLLVVAIVFMATTSFANSIEGSDPTGGYYYDADTYVAMSREMISDQEFAEDYYRSVIPAEYAEAFLYYTRDIPHIRLNFYSIMVHESGNFRFFWNVNKNGSVDMGPSQLNSDNLKNQRFLDAFRPKDESRVTTKYCYYMVMTIGYYNDLYNRLGDKYAFYAYNGGDRAANLIRKNNKSARYVHLIENVKKYDAAVRRLVQEHANELQQYVMDRRLEHVLYIIETHNRFMLGREYKTVLPEMPIELKDVDHPVNNGMAYIFRREDTFDFKPDEFTIIRKSLIYGLNNQIG